MALKNSGGVGLAVCWVGVVVVVVVGGVEVTVVVLVIVEVGGVEVTVVVPVMVEVVVEVVVDVVVLGAQEARTIAALPLAKSTRNLRRDIPDASACFQSADSCSPVM
jgi:hypothetical protein